MQRKVHNTGGSTAGAPSIALASDEMSRATAGFQRLRLDETPRGSQTRHNVSGEDGFTTVQNQRSQQSSAKIQSLKIGSGPLPSTAGSVARQASVINTGPNRKSVQPFATGYTPSVANGAFSSTQRNGFLGVPSAAAGSRASAYTNSNWRESKPAFQRPERLNGQGKPMTHLSNNRMKYSKSFYQPGMIIRSHLHESDFMAGQSTCTVEPSNPNITPSAFGNIHTKERKMVVVACYNLHYIAIPMYTHGGRGLLNKKAEEYISVRDHRDTSTDFKELSKHGMLLTQHVQSGIRLFDRMSAAHITYPVSMSYDLPVIFEGNLGPNSINHLVRLFLEYAPKVLPKT